jgi:glycosyltransferase involved in cell wall biosynthesis
MRLVVFFSRGMSLDGWRRAGILDRELALYRMLTPHLEHLSFVTYGGAEDTALAPRLSGIQVLPNRWRLPSNLYSVLAPVIHRRALGRATIFKTNQVNGAWCAVIAKRLYGKKLVVRCGFLWSDFVARLHSGTWRVASARRLERYACQAADAVVVAAEADRDTIITRYGVDAGRVLVIPNYVDTTVFRPMPEVVREPGHVIFVGRLEDQKNVLALVNAVADLPCATLTVVGDGPLRTRLEAAARRRPGAVTFLGARPQAELPALLSRAAVFALPSHYEGNPKALIEAMACGVAVAGARVPGIREIVIDGETGYLCGTSAGEIKACLQALLDDEALRDRLGAGGLAYARSHCTLQAAAERELALLQSLAATD